MAFQAKIRLNNTGPLTHSGKRGRTVKKGESFTTSDPEEAQYYQSLGGFSVSILKGKLAGTKPPKPAPVEDDDEDGDDDEEESEDEESEDDDPDGPADEYYDKADLNKLTAKDLIELIGDDDDLPLSKSDVKGMKKKEIVAAIIKAQEPSDDEDDEDDDEED